MSEHLEVILIFGVAVIALLGLDLFVVGRKSHVISIKEAGLWSAIFIGVAIIFGFVVIGPELGEQARTEYFTAYVVEKMLSVDNLFVFILVFGFFKVPPEYQHKVLFWGVLGAIIMRLVFIFLGVEFINLFTVMCYGYEINFILLSFGIFLAYTGIKTFVDTVSPGDDEDEADFSDSLGARFIKKLFPRITPDYVEDKFFVKVTLHKLDDKTQAIAPPKLALYATPLLVVVGVVEFTDLLFAVDSIPAIFSVSKDPVVLYTSNIFAILGLRSLYFLLAGLLPRFKYLGLGVSLILFFIGTKMLVAPVYHVASDISLYIILAVLSISAVGSLLVTKNEEDVTK